MPEDKKDQDAAQREAAKRERMAEEALLQTRKLAYDAITEKWTQPEVCPVCGTNQWSIGDLVEHRLFSGGGLKVGGPVFVYVPVSCNNCGNTRFFNAIQLGLVPGGDEPSAEDSSG